MLLTSSNSFSSSYPELAIIKFNFVLSSETRIGFLPMEIRGMSPAGLSLLIEDSFFWITETL